MLTRFQREWFAETTKWMDAVVKAPPPTIAENKALHRRLDQDLARPRGQGAGADCRTLAFGGEADATGEAGPAIQRPAAKAGIAPVKENSCQRIHCLPDQRGNPLHRRGHARGQPRRHPQRAAGHGQDRRARTAWTIKRATIEEKIGRPFDLQELQVHLITISGHLDETDDEFNLSWNT